MKINSEQIKKYLIQTSPFLFVDEAEILDENTITSKFNLTNDTSILNGHFPNFPILPAVIEIEIMAQTGLLFNAIKTDLTKEKYIAYFAKLESFNFKNFIMPPAIIETKIKVKPSIIANYFDISGSIFVDNKRKCFGEIVVYFKEKE
jgi:3-hydroxymyristoyl/3-hydroxydecanoyl-(acyl carrier protein) dehydratase